MKAFTELDLPIFRHYSGSRVAGRNQPPLNPFSDVPRRLRSGINPRIEKPPIIRVRNQTDDREEKEIVMDAADSLLKLANQNPWNCAKVLTKSDVGHLSRLLLPTSAVEDHILPHLDFYSKKLIRTEKGLGVTVKDWDTKDCFDLKFKWWKSSTSYVIVGGWSRNFVVRRGLEEKYEIGLFWSTVENLFVFTVLRQG